MEVLAKWNRKFYILYRLLLIKFDDALPIYTNDDALPDSLIHAHMFVVSDRQAYYYVDYMNKDTPNPN